VKIGNLSKSRLCIISAFWDVAAQNPEWVVHKRVWLIHAGYTMWMDRRLLNSTESNDNYLALSDVTRRDWGRDSTSSMIGHVPAETCMMLAWNTNWKHYCLNELVLYTCLNFINNKWTFSNFWKPHADTWHKWVLGCVSKSVSLEYVLGRFLLQGDDNSLLLIMFSHLWLYWFKKINII
jgi:hypothetical protein